MRKIFVTGIGTEVGKTVVSAVLTEALKADYWKPVQAGINPSTDSDTVKKWISNNKTVIHPESYKLREPRSPHEASEIEGVEIELDKIILPHTENTLVIEGAGGLMVPLNKRELMIDLIKRIDAETVVVIRNYLGSINHSLLTIGALRQFGIKIIGIVFNGESNEASENIIVSYSGLSVIARIAKEDAMDRSIILKYAKNILSV